MSEKGKHLAERIIEICTLTNTRCRTVGHCDTCKVPSGNRNAKHSKEECKDWNCPEHHYQPAHKIVESTMAKFLEHYFKSLTVPKISEAEAFYISEEIAKAMTILSENPTLPYEVVWERIHDEPSGDGKGGACGATGTQTTEGSTGLSGASLSPTAPETPEGVKPGGSLPLGDKGTQQMFGELLFQPPTPETPEGCPKKCNPMYSDVCSVCRKISECPYPRLYETPKGKKYGCPKSIIKNNEYFCANDGTRCHTACAWFFGWKESKGAELIAWCEEHGRETVKKVMFGHFNSKVSGFTIFFECGRRNWYQLPFLLDPVFTRPSKSSGDEKSGHGAQGNPATPLSGVGLETPVSTSPEGRLCKHLNAIDDSRCERPEDDPIHDPRTAGAHVYDPLPPDDSIDTCCYICAAHPYAWLECIGTRGDGDCSKCTPCPIFKPRSPAAATGAAAVTPIVGSAPALAETAGDTEWHSIRYYDNEKDEGVKHPTCVSLAEAKAKLAAAEKHGLKMWEDGVATANKQDAVRVERIKELEASLAMAEDAANKGDKARKEAAGMEERIAELEARLKDCEQCNLIRNAVVSEYEKEKVGLESRLAAAERRASERLAETEQYRQRMAAAETKRAHIVEAFMHGETVIETLHKRVTALETSLKGRDNQILTQAATIQDQTDRLAAAEIQPTNPGECAAKDCPTLQNYKARLKDSDTVVRGLSTLRDALKKDNENLESRLAAAEKRLILSCRCDENVITKERTRLMAAEDRIAELENILNIRTTERDVYERLNKESKEKLAAAENLRDAMRAECNHAKDAEHDAEARLFECKKASNCYRQNAIDLAARLAAAEKRYERECEEGRAQAARIDALEAATMEATKEAEVLRRRNMELESRLAVEEKDMRDERHDDRLHWEEAQKEIADLKIEVDECYAWVNELQGELDDSDKSYEEDRKTIASLLEQRDKLANEVNRLQTALDGAADLMIGGVEGPVESAITPGVYWTRKKSRTRNDLRKKHNLPEWMVYQMEWDGYHWSNKSGWTHITMEQFVADGWQLGPRVENEPKDDQYHEVK